LDSRNSRHQREAAAVEKLGPQLGCPRGSYWWPCVSASLQSSSWWSTSRPPRPSASPSRRRYCCGRIRLLS